MHWDSVEWAPEGINWYKRLCVLLPLVINLEGNIVGGGVHKWHWCVVQRIRLWYANILIFNFCCNGARLTLFVIGGIWLVNSWWRLLSHNEIKVDITKDGISILYEWNPDDEVKWVACIVVVESCHLGGWQSLGVRRVGGELNSAAALSDFNSAVECTATISVVSYKWEGNNKVSHWVHGVHVLYVLVFATVSSYGGSNRYVRPCARNWACEIVGGCACSEGGCITKIWSHVGRSSHDTGGTTGSTTGDVYAERGLLTSNHVCLGNSRVTINSTFWCIGLLSHNKSIWVECITSVSHGKKSGSWTGNNCTGSQVHCASSDSTWASNLARWGWISVANWAKCLIDSGTGFSIETREFGVSAFRNTPDCGVGVGCCLVDNWWVSVVSAHWHESWKINFVGRSAVFVIRAVTKVEGPKIGGNLAIGHSWYLIDIPSSVVADSIDWGFENWGVIVVRLSSEVCSIKTGELWANNCNWNSLHTIWVQWNEPGGGLITINLHVVRVPDLDVGNVCSTIWVKRHVWNCEETVATNAIINWVGLSSVPSSITEFKFRIWDLLCFEPCFDSHIWASIKISEGEREVSEVIAFFTSDLINLELLVHDGDMTVSNVCNKSLNVWLVN